MAAAIVTKASMDTMCEGHVSSSPSAQIVYGVLTTGLNSVNPSWFWPLLALAGMDDDDEVHNVKDRLMLDDDRRPRRF